MSDPGFDSFGDWTSLCSCNGTTLRAFDHASTCSAVIAWYRWESLRAENERLRVELSAAREENVSLREAFEKLINKVDASLAADEHLAEEWDVLHVAVWDARAALGDEREK